MTAQPHHTILEVTQIGNSLGVVLPRELLAELNLEKGDKLVLTKSSDGYRVIRPDSDFDRQMTVARSIMKRRRNVLRELAK